MLTKGPPACLNYNKLITEHAENVSSSRMCICVLFIHLFNYAVYTSVSSYFKIRLFVFFLIFNSNSNPTPPFPSPPISESRRTLQLFPSLSSFVRLKLLLANLYQLTNQYCRYLPVHVHVVSVVTPQCRQSSQTNGERKKRLGCRVMPNLAKQWSVS